jgi:hypothetical protein
MTPQFKSWFGKSLVVDGKENPLRVYHGSQKDFDTFTHTKAHLNQKHAGFFFTDDPRYAEDYSGLTQGSNIIPVYLKLENPMSYQQYINIVRYGSLTAPKTPEEISKGWAKARTVDMAVIGKQLGYDGVITDKASEFGHPEIKGTPKTFIVFSPNQIKSAIGNKGTYNPEDERITESTDYRQVSSENEAESSDLNPLFSFMTESKAFRNDLMVEKYNTKELSEILFTMLLSLHVIGSTNEVKQYCKKTLMFPRFDHIFLSTTDMANAITTLRNAREFLNQPNFDVPINELKRYLRDLFFGKLTPEFCRAFFMRLQTKLRIKNASLLIIKRELVDGNPTQGQAMRIGDKLYQQLARLDRKVDVLTLLQVLMDRSLNESKELKINGLTQFEINILQSWKNQLSYISDEQKAAVLPILKRTVSGDLKHLRPATGTILYHAQDDLNIPKGPVSFTTDKEYVDFFGDNIFKFSVWDDTEAISLSGLVTGADESEVIVNVTPKISVRCKRLSILEEL